MPYANQEKACVSALLFNTYTIVTLYVIFAFAVPKMISICSPPMKSLRLIGRMHKDAKQKLEYFKI